MALVYQGLPFVKSAMVMAVFLAPLVEETAKFLCVRWTVYERPEFNEPMDGMVYAAAAALGFASVENIVYVTTEWFSGGPFMGTLVLAARSVLSVPAHALFASFWGLALGWSKGRKGFRPASMVFLGLLSAMVLHGLFNWLSSQAFLGGLGFLALVAIAWRIVFLMIRKALRASPFAEKAEGGEG
jgi:RsiW-degrading membrane proteinase PrsW (M82 family)